MTQQKYSAWFVLLVGIFIACLITANVIAVKVVSLFGLIVPAAIIIFPVSYIAGDVLTEVYGYRQARRVIWLGFVCNLLAVMVIAIGQVLPGAPFWTDGDQAAYVRILGFTPRLLTASFIAYLIGEFANSFVLARMKVVTQGRWLWMRTIGSTLVGQGLDSLVFITIAFVGVMPTQDQISLVLTHWWFKVAYEALATPLTYAIVDFFKRQEGVDVYDKDISFSPLSLS